MEVSNLARATIVATVEGGDLVVHDSEGEIRFVRGYTAGVYPGIDLLRLCQSNDVCEWSPGLTVLMNGGQRALPTPYGEGATRSGANPDYQPRKHTDFELEMRKLVETVVSRSSVLERQLRSAEKAVRDRKSVEKDPAASTPAAPAASTPAADESSASGEDPSTEEPAAA
jgi:hypothetical protein